MKPEDKARLNAAIEYAETVVGSTHNIYEMRWMRGIIDEQAAEIVQLREHRCGIRCQPADGPSGHAKGCVYQQLAEERAKLAATAGLVRNLCIQLNAAEEGRTLAEERADKAERELAESNSIRGDALRSCAIVEERAEKAEARVAELQALVDAATPIVEVSPLRIALARALAVKEKEPTR